MSEIARTRPDGPAPPRDEALNVEGVYDSHADFVWLTLQRMGIPARDLEDVCQDVFIVVHRRLASYKGEAKLSAWLFGICLKVAAAYRRRAHRRHEQLTDLEPVMAAVEDHASPENRAATNQFRRRLQNWLDGLGLEHRVVFVMFEMDGLSCDEISRQLGIPVGTVYSRLHKARKGLSALANEGDEIKRST